MPFGEHAFSLISAGVSRARLNGEPVLDAWSGWRRGDTYFTFGCNEVVHRRALRAGEVIELVVEFSSVVPDGGLPRHFGVLRVGAAHVLGDRVAAASPRCVVVLQSGAPLLLPWLDAVPAVLQAWYPGQQCGNAIADVLLGAADPGGRLPQTWPLRVEDTVAFGDARQYPDVDGHVTYSEGLSIGDRHHETRGIAPRFAFGHGLSYSRFVYEGITLDRDALRPGETLTVALTVAPTVRNTGARVGCDVVQLHVHDETSTLPRPPQELKGFAKVTGASSVDLRQRAWVTLLSDWIDPVKHAPPRPAHLQ